ncbi:hypothetical protein HFD88_002542 [Aspergillus terreus]|nr:hypothetical protein HFD88_002542 [Aspergillus terreus]
MVRPVTEDDIGLRVLYVPTGKEKVETADETIDIVAIHGIGAHPDDTWCKRVSTEDHGPEYVNWLADTRLLPSVAPTSRIMRYGYHSQWFGEDAIRQKVSVVADRFLRALKRERQAILEAYHYEDEWPGIFHSTTGLLFFGTPFRGAEGLSQVEMIEAALREYDEESIQGEVLQVLAPGNEFLQDLVDKFGRLRSLPNKAEVACFYELRPSNVGAIVGKQKRIRFAVSESSGCLDLSDATAKYSLSRAHFEMNKFGKPSEEDFQTVRSYNLTEYFPPSDQGSILVTSRLKSLLQYGTGLELKTVTHYQAIRILEGSSNVQIKDAHLVVEILGGLPLALTQAGAYLRSTKMPTHTWVKLYEDTWKSLMKSQNRLLSHGDALGSESALTAWNMSFTRVEAENRDAGFLLKLWAFLDCGDLSHALVAYATHLEEYVEVPGWLTSLANDELRFYDAVGVLSRYSLVDHFEYQINGQTISTYTMHPVVHKWCSQLMVSADATGTEVVLICRLANQYATEGKPELAEELYNHAHTVIRDVTSPCEGISRHVRLILLGMFHLGTVYQAQGGLIKAEGVYHQVLGEIRDALVHDEEMNFHYTAGTFRLLKLGDVHEDRNDLEKAEKLWELRSSYSREAQLSVEPFIVAAAQGDTDAVLLRPSKGPASTNETTHTANPPSTVSWKAGTKTF